MNYVKMKYKDYEFSANPSTISVKSDRIISFSPLFKSYSVTENISQNPIVINGEGEFFGDEAKECCMHLATLVNDDSSGWLFLPSYAPIKMFFSSFEFKQSAQKNSFEYSFEFVEDCNGKKNEYDFGYTYAVDGENAFDIAFRVNCCVDDIMTLNDFKDPFSIGAGCKVYYR